MNEVLEHYLDEYLSLDKLHYLTICAATTLAWEEVQNRLISHTKKYRKYTTKRKENNKYLERHWQTPHIHQ